jgi:hypothetical protein
MYAHVSKCKNHKIKRNINKIVFKLFGFIYLINKYKSIKKKSFTTWEAEIERITIQGQPGQIVCETPHLQNNQSKNGLEVWLKW